MFTAGLRENPYRHALNDSTSVTANGSALRFATPARPAPIRVPGKLVFQKIYANENVPTFCTQVSAFLKVCMRRRLCGEHGFNLNLLLQPNLLVLL